MLKMTLPKAVQNALMMALEDHASCFNKYETHCLPVEVEAIEHQIRDGFIPYTNGGYTLSFMSDLSLAWGSGSHSKVVAPFIDSCLSDALKWFKDENPSFNIGDDSEENNELLEKFYEYEQEYMCESSEFWYQLRVLFFAANNYRNITGEDEIYIISGTNTDFSYGRDGGLQVAFKKTLKVSELTPDLITETIQDAINSI